MTHDYVTFTQRLTGAARRLLLPALALSLCAANVACTSAPKDEEKVAESTEETSAPEAAAADDKPVDTSRIVSLNGTVTEILIELGLQDNLVGVDISSTYPEELSELPNIGYYRQLSDEGILGLSPTFIIGENEAGPLTVMRRLRAANVALSLLAVELTEEGTYTRITDVAKAVEREAEGEAFLARFKEELAASKVAPGLPADQKPRILGVYARGAGLSMVGGSNTAFHVLIELVGAENAVGNMKGFQPLSPEALAVSNADAILIPKGALEALGGERGLLSFPGMMQTPAGKNRHILVYDDLLLTGLGPRLPELVTTLRADLATLFGDTPDSGESE